MKKLTFTIFALLVFALCQAQSAQQIKNDKHTWIYGEGYGATEQLADEAAIADLLSKISVTVRSEFVSKERESMTNGNVDAESNFQSIIKSYSSATLNNTERLVLEQEPDAVVLRYIRRSEVDRIFQARQDKAVEFVRLANDALSKGQIDDALRYYYWALCLVRSLRYPDKAIAYVDGVEQTLQTWLPRRIEEVCSDISLSVTPSSNDECTLIATYKGAPVRSMDYTYNLGQGYGGIFSVRDGKGIIELAGASPEQLTVKVEFEFRGLAVIDREVETAMSSQSDVFRKAYIPIDMRKSGQAPKIVAAEASSRSTNAAASAAKIALKGDDLHEYVQLIRQIHRALTEKDPSLARALFTNEGFAELQKILAYGKYTVNKDLDIQAYADEANPGTVWVRGLSCQFRFGTKRTFNEQITFTFDGDKVSHVALGLGKQMAEEEILSHNGWDEHSRKSLVAFLEDYRTAYATKDIDYLERVFDDNAVIIVGKVLQVAPQLNNEMYSRNRAVQTTRYTKRQFMQHLRRSFLSKEYINLHFSNCEVVKLGDLEVYGIQVKQDYYSNNYGDSGYLYLLVDLNDPREPVIHVRTWQEAPDPNFGIIGPGDF